jgi:AraC-like DNA-binding protein
MGFPCRFCDGETRVVNTEQRTEGRHRWARCLDCGQITRTLEEYFPRKPGAKRGSRRPGTGPKGSQHASAVLTEDNVRLMRQLRREGMPIKEIAQRFGMSRDHIGRILNRKLWKHVP